MKYQSLSGSFTHGGWMRPLQDFCRPFVFLVVLLIFQISQPCQFFVCEASTVSVGRSAATWNQRRKDFQKRVLSGVHIASNDVKGKQTRDELFEYVTDEPIGLAGYRSDYAEGNNTLLSREDLKSGLSQSFVFRRFQSPASIRMVLQSIRSASSFKWFEDKDGRKGYVSSTKLGGDYVLAESEQIAIDCTTEDVLRVYLSGELQARWNTKNCDDCQITKFKKEKYPSQLGSHSSRNMRTLKLWSGKTNEPTEEAKDVQHDQDNMNAVDRKDRHFYLQDLFVKSQRVIRTQTGPMRYQQIIEIDKVGPHNYAVLVRLLKSGKNSIRESILQRDNRFNTITTTAKKPFESLEVYVGLEQMGSDVKIYAAGVFEVNRRVVPKIMVFDTSGFAGAIAGKGTLWLAGYFEEVSRKRRIRELSVKQ